LFYVSFAGLGLGLALAAAGLDYNTAVKKFHTKAVKGEI